MTHKAISINNKGIILGNPLRFLDCDKNSSFQEIQRSYKEITQIRLKAADSYYIPQNDPFRLIDPIKIDRYNAQLAFENLKSFANFHISKILYISRNNPELLEKFIIKNIKNQKALHTKTALRKIGTNISQKDCVFALFTAHFNSQFKAQSKYESIELLWMEIAKILNNSNPVMVKDSSYTISRVNIRNMCWCHLVSDYVKHIPELALNGQFSQALSMQRAVEKVLTSSEKTYLLNECMASTLDNLISNYIYPAKSHLQSEKILSDDIIGLLKPIDTLRELYQDRYIQLKYEFEDVGKLLRDISVNISNKYKDYIGATDLLQKAKTYIFDTDLLADYYRDLYTLKKNAEYQDETRDAEIWGKVKLYGFIALIALFAIIFIAGLFDKDNFSNKSNYQDYNSSNPENYTSDNNTTTSLSDFQNQTSPYTAKPKINSYNNELSNMSALIDINNATLEINEQELSILSNDLNNLETEIKDIENKLSDYEIKYNLGNETYFDKYNNLFDVYKLRYSYFDKKLEEYNQTYDAYKKLHNETKILVDRYNEKIR